MGKKKKRIKAILVTDYRDASGYGCYICREIVPPRDELGDYYLVYCKTVKRTYEVYRSRFYRKVETEHELILIKSKELCKT